MDNRKVLYAADGMVLTNGTDYGKVIFLAEGGDEMQWQEITQEEADGKEADAIVEKFGGIDNGEY